MRQTTRFLAGFMLLFLFMASPCNAEVVWCENCSDKWTQAIEKATSLDQLAKMSDQLVQEISQTQQQIAMVQQNIQQYENMIKNTMSLPADIMNRLQGEYTRLASLYKDVEVRQGDLQGMRRAFADIYQTETGDYTQSWQTWSAEVDRATGATFEQSGRQLQDLQNADEFDSRIQGLLTTPEGRMEAQQAGNQLMAMQIQEMREMRAMMATAMQEQAVVNAKKEKQDQAAKEHMEQVLGKREVLAPQQAGSEIFF